MKAALAFTLALFALLLSGCAMRVPDAKPQAQFMARLTALCGKAFAGRIASDPASDADMVGKALARTIHEATALGSSEHDLSVAG